MQAVRFCARSGKRARQAGLIAAVVAEHGEIEPAVEEHGRIGLEAVGPGETMEAEGHGLIKQAAVAHGQIGAPHGQTEAGPGSIASSMMCHGLLMRLVGECGQRDL